MTSAPTAAPPFEHRRLAASNTVFKSGPLFISSKGIGWKSWKKRWFILTRTSLVFFKTDPSVLPQKNGEVNLTLGGIDLNNSGSVVVREDKKLLTVLFPDGRDGRAFTLKAETSEDLFEWKTALELALAQAPNAALVMGHNGIFRNDNPDTFEGSIQTWNKRPAKSLVVGRPILLALEDIDGGPSFLEKALRFLEEYGMKVEGILRQSADVEEVDKRVQEYEHGKTEFTSDEDAHVVGDCVKHVLRELPSSPVPASCCTALLEAYRLENKEARVNAMRLAISETFPEPNRRLLQRILKMMNTIAAHTAENRMSASAVAACMAPLLLRPLLAGECELEDEFDMNEDTSAQLLAAANAANNAQAIVTTLMEEFRNIFDEDSLHRCSSPDSQMDESESDELTDDEKVEAKGNGYHDAEEDTNPVTNNDLERVLSGKLSESSGYSGRDLYDYKVFANDDSDEESTKYAESKEKSIDSERGSQTQYSGNGLTQLNMENTFSDKDSLKVLPVHDGRDSTLSMGEILSSLDGGMSFGSNINDYCVEKHTNKVNGSNSHTKRSNFWGRNTGKKNQSSESVDSSGEEELAIQRLESTKNDLRMRIAKEAKGNAILQASLERRKQALHERRLALEHDVSRLQEQLQAERDLRAALEVGLSMSSGQFTSSRSMDSKTRAELEEIALAEADVTRLKQKVAELHLQLNQQRQDRIGSFTDDCSRYQHNAANISPQRVLQQGFDRSIACCNHEKKQKSEESSSGTDWRTNKPQSHPITNIKQLSRQRSFETTPNEMKVSDAAYGTCSEPNSASSSTSGSKLTSEGIDFRLNQPSAAIASATLLELTTRLDFFKERRSQLMEQLHNLDRNHAAPSLSQAYRSSPPWNHSPR